MSEESRKMAKLAVEALDDKKAEDIKVIDISNVSVIADYFIIAGGNNSSQIQALCDNVEEKMGRAGFPARQTEGYETANWVLLDFGDVIVLKFLYGNLYAISPDTFQIIEQTVFLVKDMYDHVAKV